MAVAAGMQQGLAVGRVAGDVQAAQAADGAAAGDELEREILGAPGGRGQRAGGGVVAHGEVGAPALALLLEAFALGLADARCPGQGVQAVHGQGTAGEAFELAGAGLDAAVEQVADRHQALRLARGLHRKLVADVLAGSGQARLPVGAFQALQPDVAEDHQGAGNQRRYRDVQRPARPVTAHGRQPRQQQRQHQEDAQGVAGPPEHPGFRQLFGGQPLQQEQRRAAEACADQAGQRHRLEQAAQRLGLVLQRRAALQQWAQQVGA